MGIARSTTWFHSLTTITAATVTTFALVVAIPETASGATPHLGRSGHTAPRHNTVTSDDLKQTGPDQQRWLSLPGSRIAANPVNTPINTSEVAQNGGDALPLGSRYIAGDKSTPQRNLMQTSVAAGAEPPRSSGYPDTGRHPAFTDDFGTSDETRWRTNSGGGSLTSDGRRGTVTVGNDTKAGSVKRTVTVDLDKDPIIAVKVPKTSGQWAMKVRDVDPDFDWDVTLQNDTSDTGTFTYDLRAVTGWSGTKTFDIKIWAIGGQGATTTYDKMSIFRSGADGWDRRARTYSTSWSPSSLGYRAGYGRQGKLRGDDHFHDKNSLVRTVNTQELRGRAVVSGAYDGDARWDPRRRILTVTSAEYTRAYQFPRAARVTFSQAAGWRAQSEPSGTTTYWNASLPSGGTYRVAIGFAVGGDAAAAAHAVKTAEAAQAASPRHDVRHWTHFWNGILARVPKPQDFSLHGIARAGVTAREVKKFYYRGWINLEENVLPATPETGNYYVQVGTDKADNWMKGTPGTKNAASWDSLLGIQNLAYLDPKTAWAAFKGMMALVGDDGNLGGETLPSRKAQTAWVLYRVTGKKKPLDSTYDALSRQLIWESKNLRWESPSNDIPDERNASFASSLIVDLDYAGRIAKSLGKRADVKKWKSLRQKLIANYTDWFFTDDGTPLSLHYVDGSHEDETGDVIAETTGLDIPDLPDKYAGYLMKRFNGSYDPHRQFAGLAPDALKAPHEQLTVYGLLARGKTRAASTVSNSVLRDVVRSGRYAEVYQQSSVSLAGTPIARGVWPSLFGISNVIDAVWMNNGYRADQGDPTGVRFSGCSGGITGLTHLGRPYTVKGCGRA